MERANHVTLENQDINSASKLIYKNKNWRQDIWILRI